MAQLMGNVEVRWLKGKYLQMKKANHHVTLSEFVAEVQRTRHWSQDEIEQGLKSVGMRVEAMKVWERWVNLKAQHPMMSIGRDQGPVHRDVPRCCTFLNLMQC